MIEEGLAVLGICLVIIFCTPMGLAGISILGFTIDLINESKNKNIKQKWFTLKEKLPDLNTYVLLYVNRPWNDKDDNPKYVVAKFVANCEYEDKIKYKFEQFGPDTFTMNEVKYWTNIDKLDKYFKS